MAVLWESTDQFGNMFIGVSSAVSVDELSGDLRSLVDELIQRGSEGKVTVDFDFGEINGPDPEAVSHVLQCPWLGECDGDTVFGEIERVFGEMDCGFELARA
jgi:hypothetical protein